MASAAAENERNRAAQQKKLTPVDYDPFADTTSPLDGHQAKWN